MRVEIVNAMKVKKTDQHKSGVVKEEVHSRHEAMLIGMSDVRFKKAD